MKQENGWGQEAMKRLSAVLVLTLALGCPLPLARIARATRETELHPDVHALFDAVRGLLAGTRPR